MVLVIFTYYIIYFITILISKPKRTAIIERNEKLDKLRHIPVKTLEQQKEFILTKYPTGSGKFKWFSLVTFIVKAIIFIGVFMIIRFGVVKANLEFTVLQGIILIAGLIVIINYVLKPYKLQTTDLDSMFKW
jgi:hypothetical protein